MSRLGYRSCVLLTVLSALFTVVTGQCQFDQRCFRYSLGCTLACAYPYQRQTPISCTACLNMCLMQQGLCRAVVYDSYYRTCDLFAVNAMYNGLRLMKWRGRCYFQPTGYCHIQTATPAPPPPASCPNGQTAKLVAIKDYEMPGMNGKTVPNVDQHGCEQACLKNQLPDGTQINCKLAQYGPGGCMLATSQGSGVEGQVRPASGSTFYQKLCLTGVENCPDVFEEDPQKILVGQNRQTVDASSFQDCLQRCLNSQSTYGFTCKSGMFYYQESSLNCILNVESKSTKPDLFTTAPDTDRVTYFEPGCNNGRKFDIKAMAKLSKKVFTEKDQPMKGDWTLWSPCTKDNKQVRFMQCYKLDPRKCEKQEKGCGEADKLEEDTDERWFKQGALKDQKLAIHDGNADASFTPCKSFLKSGNKSCTFGTQQVDGDIIYCTSPIDC